MDSKIAEFDYIIVGAGIGGLVLTSRLSEDANCTVLLLEAGPDRTGDPRINIPGMMSKLSGDPDIDWDYMSEPQAHVNNRRIGQPRGRVLGGSSAINFGLIVYPSRSNFEAWAQLGNKGWGPDEMALYLRKFHTYTPPIQKTAELLATDEYLNADHQGADGPVPVTLPDVYNEFNQAWNEAFRGLGWDTTADPIGGEKLGTFACPLSVDGKGRRGYAMAYYTAEVAQRSNLTLRTETLVGKVRFDQAQGMPRATGVQVRIENGGSECITARREVILSAGCISSPQLLELSGVGRAETLRQHGIPVVLDCPGVGENLQDHAMVTLCFEVADGQVSGDALRDPNVLQPLIKQYEAAGNGPMAGAPASVAYLPLVDDRGRLSREAVQQLLADHDEEGSPKVQPQYEIMKQRLLAVGK